MLSWLVCLLTQGRLTPAEPLAWPVHETFFDEADSQLGELVEEAEPVAEAPPSEAEEAAGDGEETFEPEPELTGEGEPELIGEGEPEVDEVQPKGDASSAAAWLGLADPVEESEEPATEPVGQARTDKRTIYPTSAPIKHCICVPHESGGFLAGFASTQGCCCSPASERPTGT